MPLLNLLSAAEQVAAHLRANLMRGQWSGLMPGVNRLAPELGVNRKTVEVALRQLEREGLLAGRGRGRRRVIVLPGDGLVRRPLRVALLLFEPADRHLEYVIELQHALEEAGHAAIFPARSLTDLRMDVPRIGRLVNQTEADVWVVLAGARAVLEWFSAQPFPAFALFGRRHGLPIAGIGPDKAPACIAVARRLTELGHRRICMLVRQERRIPDPGVPEKAFLDELASLGIRTGPYNLPAWEESAEGFHALLESLFKTTPPTALITDDPGLFFATQQFLMNRGLRVPETVSLICTDESPYFAWCRPSIAHMRWESRPVVTRILRWASNVSRGKRDVRQTFTQAELVPGGTMGPAPKP